MQKAIQTNQQSPLGKILCMSGEAEMRAPNSSHEKGRGRGKSRLQRGGPEKGHVVEAEGSRCTKAEGWEQQQAGEREHRGSSGLPPPFLGRQEGMRGKQWQQQGNLWTAFMRFPLPLTHWNGNIRRTNPTSLSQHLPAHYLLPVFKVLSI